MSLSNSNTTTAINNDHETKRKKTPSYFTVGGLSGVITCVLLQPLDLLKTRLQQQQQQPLQQQQQQQQYFHRGRIWHETQRVIRQHGVIGLWRGTLPTLIRNVPGQACYFAIIEQLREHWQHYKRYGNGPLTPTEHLVIGATARILAGMAVMPLTVAKARFESSNFAYRNLWQAFRHMIGREGIRGLFLGFGVTAMRDAPYAGLFLYFYEGSKSALFNQERNNLSITGNHLLAGMTAGLLATTITQPFDLVKTRVQVQPHIYHNAWSATRIIIQHEGWRGFFDGLILRISRKAVSSALTWTVYEEVIRRWQLWQSTRSST
ncbi:mitochondrial carrier domain-containing protein [Syncephalis plumigaleata]|nr:mitochondrial carrier domain-containing protein [Syncephalis plumigaleata]